MSHRLLVSTRKGLFVVDRRSSGWAIERASFIGDNVTLALPDPRDGAYYAALDHGHFGVKLHRSRDGGESWEEIAAPAYPEKPEGDDDKDPMTQKPRQWKLKLVWSLEAGLEDEPGRLWCGTIPGALFRSDDHGASWSIVRALWDDPKRREWFGGGAEQPGIHSILVDPRRPGRVLIGVSCGGVWETTDAGESWACRADGMRAAYLPPEQAGNPNLQDPHQLDWCAADQDVVWCQHHNGIFRSTDGARSWKEITDAGPSTFGFAVAAHPKDQDTAWFVPATKDEKRFPVGGRVVVTRTRDGGRTFDVLREGLPQDHAYDLCFRHGLDVDATGRRLAFGSTTGSLWVSEDEGDSWSAISEHLPPVYAVRFA